MGTVQERFFSKVDKNGPIPAHIPELGPCWLWLAGISKSGYGGFKFNKKATGAHQASWIIAHGPYPKGILVCHRCDVKLCVNPSHLFLGTYTDNVLDAKAKGRLATGNKRGTYLHPETLARGDRNGSRTKPERLRRGETHPISKLTDAIVKSMRFEHIAHGIGPSALARIHGISKVTAREVLRNHTWKHVTDTANAN